LNQFELEPCEFEGNCKLLAGTLAVFCAPSFFLAPRIPSKHFPVQINEIIKFT